MYARDVGDLGDGLDAGAHVEHPLFVEPEWAALCGMNESGCHTRTIWHHCVATNSYRC